MARDKGRIVVWSILGLAVVVVAILFLTADRGDKRPVDVRAFTRNKERTIGQLEQKAAALRGQLGSEADASFAQMDQGIARAREFLGQMQGVTDQKELRTLRDSTALHLDAASDILDKLD